MNPECSGEGGRPALRTKKQINTHARTPMHTHAARMRTHTPARHFQVCPRRLRCRSLIICLTPLQLAGCHSRERRARLPPWMGLPCRPFRPCYPPCSGRCTVVVVILWCQLISSYSSAFTVASPTEEVLPLPASVSGFQLKSVSVSVSTLPLSGFVFCVGGSVSTSIVMSHSWKHRRIRPPPQVQVMSAELREGDHGFLVQ